MATAVLSWAGKSFASGLVSAAGGMAFTHFLEYVGVKQPTSKIRDQLIEMAKVLDDMAAGIGQLNQRVESLAGQLAISTLEIKEQIKQTGMYDAIANIQTHTVVPPVLQQGALRAKQGKAAAMKLTSMADVIEGSRAFRRVPPEVLEAFFNDVLGIWDIARSVKTINLGLMGESSEDGLLVLLTQLSITKMGSRQLSKDLFGHYENLEQRFLSILATQMAGVYLVMAAKCFGAPAGTIPPDADRYLYKDFVPNMLLPQLDRFLWCTEKLALSQGAWRTPWPITDDGSYIDEKTGKREFSGGLGTPPELSKILLRSELITRRLQETFRDMRTYKPKYSRRALDTLTEEVRSRGFYVHRLLRDSDVKQNQGPELKPWSDSSSASKGRALPATGVAIPRWTGAKDGFAKLANLEDGSNLRVVRYFWPLIDHPGTDFEASFKALGFKTYVWEELKAMGLDWYGFFASYAMDQSTLLVPPQFDQPSTGVWKVGALTGADRWTTAKFSSDRLDKPLMIPDAEHAYFRAAFRLDASQVSDGTGLYVRTVEVRMECPVFQYEGIQERQVLLHLWLSLHTSRNMVYKVGHNIGCRLVVNLKTPQGDKEIYNTDKVTGKKIGLWDWAGEGHGVPQSGDEPHLAIPISVGKTAKREQYSVQLVAQILHNGYGAGTAATLSASVKECALSWPSGPVTPLQLSKVKPRKKPKAPKRKPAKKRRRAKRR